MEQTIAAAATWALVLLCVALYRSGQWRVAIPIASETSEASPVEPSAGDEEEPEVAPGAAERPRFPASLGLPGMVMATAALRISLLVALGR